MVREKPSDSTVQVGLGPHDALWVEGKSSMEISRCSLGIIHSWRGGGLELGVVYGQNSVLVVPEKVVVVHLRSPYLHYLPVISVSSFITCQHRFRRTFLKRKRKREGSDMLVKILTGSEACAGLLCRKLVAKCNWRIFQVFCVLSAHWRPVL
jgi:hypothetical protein